MKKLLNISIALATIVVATKAMCDRDKKIEIWRIRYSSQENAWIQLQEFINNHNYIYLGHELDDEYINIIYRTRL